MVAPAVTWWGWLIVAWFAALIVVAAVQAIRWAGRRCPERWPDWDAPAGVGCVRDDGHRGPHVARSGHSWGWGR